MCKTLSKVTYIIMLPNGDVENIKTIERINNVAWAGEVRLPTEVEKIAAFGSRDL